MTDNELLLAISDLLDKKLKIELQAQSDELRGEMHEMEGRLRAEFRGEMHEMRTELRGEFRGEMQEMRGEMQEMRGEMQEMRGEMQEMRGEMQEMRTEIQEIKNDLTGIHLHLENVTDRNIQLLAENYLPAAKRYEKEAAKMEAMRIDIDVMKDVLRDHSEMLQELIS